MKRPMDRRKFLRGLAVLASSSVVFPAFAASPKLEELEDFEKFRRLFNEALGIPRIVLLLSPT